MSESYGSDGGNYGWTPNPEATAAIVASLPYPTFAEAAPDLIGDEDRDAFLWQACIAVTGAHLPAHKQSIGCCTSEGSSSAVDYLQCVLIALQKRDLEFKPVSHAVMYGLGRAAANMLGGGDGCYGGAMAQAMHESGTVSNEDAKDSGTDDTLARQYGSRGVPAALKELAKKHIVQTVSQVKTADAMRAALQNGYPGFVCSGQGFTMKRDATGKCQPSGSWAHCMGVIGYRAADKCFCILQSWGQETPSGPVANGQPDCSFWIDSSVMDKMLGQNDSFVVSGYDGFPAQTIPWVF